MELEYNRTAALKEFDDRKSGVKGLVDAGVNNVPKIFILPTEVRPRHTETSHISKFQVPLIDLQGMDGCGREEIINQIRQVSETWGFFQIVNHGIPVQLLDEIIDCIRRFHEQPNELKMEAYNRDPAKKVMYLSNYDLFQSHAASWRDSLICYFDLGGIDAQELPPICREAILEYTEQVIKLGEKMAELLSESLGLGRSFFKDINCVDAITVAAHYYPPCPEPDLTQGICSHTDASFMTFLLQDQVGGLQVLHNDTWVDVTPTHGVLVVNIGDLAQILTNDKYQSIKHRVPASLRGPRISVASFLNPKRAEERKYGPIKELLSESCPPKYKETTIGGLVSYFFSRGLEDYTVNQFRL